jgi:serpin B
MESRNGFLGLVAGISLMFIAQCGHDGTVSDPTAPGSNQGVVTTQEGAVTVQSYAGGRDSLPTVSSVDLAALAKGNTDFACDLYRKLSSSGSNTFLSPYSISMALAMTWAGANGRTESQMASALHFSLDQSRLHPAFDALDLALRARAQKDGFDLDIINQVWGEKTYHFLPQYLRTLDVSYGAAMRLLDFVNAPDPSRLTINAWVSDQTQTRIQDLIPQGAVTADTRLVLTNAIYFKAQWADTFFKQDSWLQTFYRDNDSVTAVFMHRDKSSYKYDSTPDYSALEIPYNGGEISMLFILPAPGKMAAVESGLSSDFLAGLSGSLQEKAVNVAIPKFKFATSSTGLKDVLISLGMTDAFSGAADFSGIDGTRYLYISDAIHKAFVAVDERGTEAAAATAVIMDVLTVEISPQTSFIANRPFIFLIRDNVTGSVLFVGKLVSPVSVE